MSPDTPLRLADSVVVLVDYQQRLLPLIDRADTVVAEALRLADVAPRAGRARGRHRAEPGRPRAEP